MPAVNYYIALPVTLYRMTLGGKVRVRKHTAEAGLKYDIVAEGPDETVKPKWQDLVKYQAPNGLSMRPMTPVQKDLIETFNGTNVQVAYIPKDTALPSDLVVVHEWTKGNDSHYSLQPKTPMKLSDFQTKVQEFLKAKGTAIERNQWLLKNSPPVQPHGPNKEPLKWDTNARKWYYTDSKMKKNVWVASKK